MSNLKDTITSICGLIIAVGGSLLGIVASGAVVLPSVVTTILGVLVAVATALIGYFTGKAPDGTAKSVTQVTAQNVK